MQRILPHGARETKRGATARTGRASLLRLPAAATRSAEPPVSTRPAAPTLSPALARPAWLSRRALGALGLLAVLALVALGVALAAGSVTLAPGELWRGLTEPDAGLASTLVRELRLPRALSAFAIGGLLALAGALMQILLRNPLADPYVLGVSGGAATFALLVLAAGLGGAWVHGGAFLGALVATLLVFALAHGTGAWTPLRLLLTGVVVAAGFGAAVSLILALGPDSSLRGMLFWLMGDLSFAREPGPLLGLLALATVAGVLTGRHLNVLARGEARAETLGVAVRPLRIGIYVAGSLLTAIAVATAGSIGFVGLVVPHLVRRLVGPDHRLLVPAAVLAGGTLLMLADTAARTVAAPRQLPVGALTALIGVPLFLVLMRRQRSVT
jgi:iron complex transport system permease protein